MASHLRTQTRMQEHTHGYLTEVIGNVTNGPNIQPYFSLSTIIHSCTYLYDQSEHQRLHVKYFPTIVVRVY